MPKTFRDILVAEELKFSGKRVFWINDDPYYVGRRGVLWFKKFQACKGVFTIGYDTKRKWFGPEFDTPEECEQWLTMMEATQ